ncbi:hypothetical protein PIB30_098243, partial [Stylosanthes scabra]|nr:hypothetical protein [Stylosanthes scabra]
MQKNKHLTPNDQETGDPIDFLVDDVDNQSSYLKIHQVFILGGLIVTDDLRFNKNIGENLNVMKKYGRRRQEEM